MTNNTVKRTTIRGAAWDVLRSNFHLVFVMSLVGIVAAVPLKVISDVLYPPSADETDMASSLIELVDIAYITICYTLLFLLIKSANLIPTSLQTAKNYWRYLGMIVLLYVICLAPMYISFGIAELTNAVSLVNNMQELANSTGNGDPAIIKEHYDQSLIRVILTGFLPIWTGIIVSFILSVRFTLVPVMALCEENRQCWRRSWQATRGHFWKICLNWLGFLSPILIVRASVAVVMNVLDMPDTAGFCMLASGLQAFFMVLIYSACAIIALATYRVLVLQPPEDKTVTTSYSNIGEEW